VTAVTVTVSPLTVAFAKVGSERTAIDTLMKLHGIDRATARAIVREVRLEVDLAGGVSSEEIVADFRELAS
jgi:phosphoribosylformimino-5-aminoimidazole carboxamide ribonucleotide (ProFAR) isomerase